LIGEVILQIDEFLGLGDFTLLYRLRSVGRGGTGGGVGDLSLSKFSGVGDLSIVSNKSRLAENLI